MKLTERQAEVVELRDSGLSWAKCGDQLGIHPRTVQSTYKDAMRKIDLAVMGEDVMPEQAIELIDAATDSASKLAAAAKQCGFPPAMAKRMIQRINAKFKPFTDELKNVKRDQMIELYEDRAFRCLMYLDDFNMAGMAGRDLAVSAGILTDKALLLKGEPTAIYSHQDMRKLDELGAAIHKEMKRRGITIEGTVEK